ncbi:MAG: amidase family protein [Anaeromyxobacteraceae bacterium]|nr:amidase family protein [Anaeromyxobacteraceae bacterium]
MSKLASLARLDATAQAALLAGGEVSPEELLAAAQERIDALDPLLGAVVTRADPAPPRVRPPGPLAGVPFLVKDATPWPGLRWSLGSRLLAANAAPAQTPYGARLEAAGLVCVGKSATSEFGLLGSTETLLEGPTLNPWDLSRSATGSSGGSAAAVAAGLVPVAHANDGGGSIRIPASACGVFGFKPSRGRTPPAAFGGSDFLDLTSDHCISRSVRDSAAWLALTEVDGTSPPGAPPLAPLARRLRVGAYTRTAMGEAPEPRIAAAHEDVKRLLASLGHEVVELAPPEVDGAALGEAFFLVAGAAIDGAAAMVEGMRGAPVRPEELEPFTFALMERYREEGPDALPAARATFARLVAAWGRATRGVDVVLTPVLATEVWPLGHLSPVLPREELLRRTARAVGYTPIQNLDGAPGMSVPLTFPEGGLPIGAHFSAAPGQDRLLLSLARELEEARPWADRWPTWSIPRLP